MPEIKFKVSEGLPIDVIKFEIEKELNLKIDRLERIKQAVNALKLTRQDVDKFEAARQKAWERTKKKRAL